MPLTTDVITLQTGARRGATESNWKIDHAQTLIWRDGAACDAARNI